MINDRRTHDWLRRLIDMVKDGLLDHFTEHKVFMDEEILGHVGYEIKFNDDEWNITITLECVPRKK